jgi:hypothetical protein
MKPYFFDSSALVKRYIIETGTAWVQAVSTTPENRIYVASITIVELVSAIARRRRSGITESALATAALEEVRFDFRFEFEIIDISPEVIKRAEEIGERHVLRGYDAIQLGCAMELNAALVAAGHRPITFVSADLELNSAAASEGLIVADPNTH